MGIGYSGLLFLMPRKSNPIKALQQSDSKTSLPNMPATIYRFTPPTCTLEIIGQKSALSRWTANDALKTVRFKLVFDDPRQATSRQVAIEGSKAELTQLQTAVDRYVQTQLNSSFNLGSFSSDDISTANLPYLQPQGLTNHQLFFGSLSHNSDRQTIVLGTIQLFDLVAALEDYQTKITALPEIERAKSASQVVPLWGKVAAAAIAIASITTVANLFKPQVQQNIASDRESAESNSAIPELSEITPPNSPDANRQAVNPKLGEPLSSAKRLPPPPAVETPKPKPDIPDPADYPLSQVARQSGLDNSTELEKSPERSPKAEAEKGELANPNRQKIVADLDRDANTNPDINTQAEDPVSPEPNIAANSSTPLSQQQEIIAYFEQNWQPPADLQQSLEYRLLINSNGAIERVVPLGKAARLYLSQTKIPVNGKSFVTPSPTEQSSTIRLLLNPDGKVQAFTE